MKINRTKATPAKRKIKNNRKQPFSGTDQPYADDWRNLHFGYDEYGWLIAKFQFERSYEYKHQREIKEFCLTLFAMGGELACIHFDDAAWRIQEIAKKAKLLTYPAIISKRGEPNKCLHNCLRLLKQEKDLYTLYTGFGLSKDGLWFSHYWLVDKEGNIIETTNPSLKYFGFPLESANHE